MTAFTYATLFTGGDGAGLGYTAAGGRGLWGAESDPLIAAVAAWNGAVNIAVVNVLDLDFHDFPAPDLLHSSPPCTRISGANTGAVESPLDLAFARKTVEATEVLQPRWVIVENVPRYAGSVSAGILLDGLWAAGYWVHSQVVNAADFGVPQTRRRWILRATRGGVLPMLPAPVPWVGWYAAIADLVDTLPADCFAPWQLARLPVDLTDLGYLVSFNQGSPQADGADRGCTWRPTADPAYTLGADESRRPVRAFLVNGQNARSVEKGGMAVLPANEPSMVVPTAGRGVMRAWLDAGRVVRMTPRALARFQSFPDSYVLPDASALAAKIIGNAVPCLLAQRLAESLVTL